MTDLWGTLTALFIGIALFVAGFYALTHSEAMRRWLNLFEVKWQVWQAWR